LLGWMCPEGTQCRQGSPDAPDATRCGILVQDAQDAQDAGSRLGESGRNTTGSDAGHLVADVARITGRDVGHLVVCGGEELRPDHCVPWELLDSAGSVLVLWELPDSVRCVPYPDPLCAGMVSRLRRSRLPTREVG